MNVKPKKHFGQHFLKDQSICEKIAKSIVLKEDKESVLEIGPGTGALTKFLFSDGINLKAYELDNEAYHYLINQLLKKKYLLNLNFHKLVVETYLVMFFIFL